MPLRKVYDNDRECPLCGMLFEVKNAHRGTVAYLYNGSESIWTRIYDCPYCTVQPPKRFDHEIEKFYEIYRRLQDATDKGA